MKRLFIIFTLIIISLTINAQRFDNSNSTSRIARVVYVKNERNFFTKNKDIPVDCVDGIKSIYAYDKKHKNLYLYTDNGNYIIKVDKNTHKLYKKQKNLTKFKEKALEKYACNIDKMLTDRYDYHNSIQKKCIEDSIKCAYYDSINITNKNILKRLEESKKTLVKRYVANRDWHWIPVSNASEKMRFKCLTCNKTISNDYVYCTEIKNDTLFIREFEHLAYNTFYAHIHKAVIQNDNRNSLFEMHCNAFQDSLSNDRMYENDGVEYVNALLLNDAYGRLKQNAPYGFIDDYSWNNEYGSVTLGLTFANLSNKTIKYLEAFFSIYNEVNDLRCKGNVSGTGPIEPGNTGSWDWDYTRYYTARDSRYLYIDRIVLTYTDGTKHTLANNRSQLEFNKENVAEQKSIYNKAPNSCLIDEQWMDDWNKLQKDIDNIQKQIDIVSKKAERKYKSNSIYLPPMFLGGETAINEYLRIHVRYPPIAAEYGIEGNVKVEFMVKKDGAIEDAKILKGVDPSLDKEALRVVRAMPKWIPATADGISCDSKMTIVVGFSLK